MQHVAHMVQTVLEGSMVSGRKLPLVRRQIQLEPHAGSR
jgi:hypothetical protein